MELCAIIIHQHLVPSPHPTLQFHHHTPTFSSVIIHQPSAPLPPPTFSSLITHQPSVPSPHTNRQVRHHYIPTVSSVNINPHQPSIPSSATRQVHPSSQSICEGPWEDSVGTTYYDISFVTVFIQDCFPKLSFHFLLTITIWGGLKDQGRVCSPFWTERIWRHDILAIFSPFSRIAAYPNVSPSFIIFTNPQVKSVNGAKFGRQVLVRNTAQQSLSDYTVHLLTPSVYATPRAHVRFVTECNHSQPCVCGMCNGRSGPRYATTQLHRRSATQ